MNLQRIVRSRASQLLAFSYLLTTCIAASAQTTSPIIINEFRRDTTLSTTEYVELLLTQDLTAAQLDSYFVGDSTSTTAAKFGAYKLTNMASIAATFKAGTIIVIGGTTAIASQDTSYNPIPSGTDDNWNIRLQVGGGFLTNNGSSGDFAASDVAWVDTSSVGTTSVDSIAWPTSGLGAFGTVAKVKIAAPNNGANVEFTSDINGVDVATNYAVNSAGSLGIPNSGTNATYINSLRGGVVLPTLSLSVVPSTFLETAGASAATATLTRSGSTSGDLIVNLTSSDSSGATVPSTATIPDTQASTTFAVAAVNDAVSSANKTVTITAQSAGFVNGTFAVTVANVGAGTARIRDIQGASHRSPLTGQTVTSIPGIVTAVDTNGFYFQDPNPDTNDATSEGIFVFTSTAPAANIVVGASVQVSGTVTEFLPGNDANNLTITQITSPTVSVIGTNPLPAPITIGSGGRIPPSQVIYSGSGNLNSGGATFSPTTNGIDFYESLEGMRVQVNNAQATSITNSFGEISIVPDNGANTTGLNIRGGITIAANDFNPERIILDDGIVTPVPTVNVGDRFNAPIIGVIDYSFGNYKLFNAAALPSVTPKNNPPEVTSLVASTNQLTIADFNVENLDPSDGTRFNSLASIIVTNLRSPDILSLAEVQDNNGATNDSVVDAATTLNTLISAIAAAGGPTYQFRQINPLDDTNGGEPGGNIRVAFLYNPSRVSFVDRPGGSATTAVGVNNVGGTPQLTLSPGLIDPTNSAFNSSRKPLVGEFLFGSQRLFVIGNHFNSKGGDQPLFGTTQPPVLNSETQRNQQATLVASFVDSLRAVDINAKVVVLGDLNDFEFSTPMTTLKGNGRLINLAEALIANPKERYTYVFDGNSQSLDHILTTSSLVSSAEYDVVHVNAEYTVQPTDHDPSIARLSIGSPVITSFSPTGGSVGTIVTITGTAFFGTTAVTFNGTPASFTVNGTNDGITATVPLGATTGPIAVTTPNGTATSSTSFSLIAPAPSITSFTPTSASVGTNVSIVGSGFTSATSVQFNGTPALSYTINSDTSITVTVPNGATTGSIAVVTPSGTATSTTSFTVLPSPTPSITSFNPTTGGVGLSVVITGSSFTGATAVQFNGIAATSFTINSNTQITATVPAGATTGLITVLTPGGTATSAGSFMVVLPAVSQDPAIVGTPAQPAGNAAAVGTIATSANGSNPAAAQFLATGATFPAIILRNLLDFYGIAIPNTAVNIGQVGSTGFQPFNSPRANFLQYNYCSTGSGNGRNAFIGTATASASCSYVSATSGAVTILGAPNQAPTALPSPAVGAAYAFTAYPNFPTGVQASITPAPLFAFTDAVASVSGLSGTEITTYATNKLPTRGNPVQVPVLFGATVPAFNAGTNGGVSPSLTVGDLCRIFDGQITDYSQLAAPSTTGLSGSVNLFIRSDSSGTTQGFTGYLAAACPGAGVVTPGFTGYYITTGLNVFPTAAGQPSATFQRRPGNDGVADAVATTTGGFGYVESSFAQPLSANAPITTTTPAPIQAALQNPVSGSFLTATTNNVRNALANIGLSPNATYPCVLTVTGLPAAPTVGNAYPIVTQTYSLTYTRYGTQPEVNAVRNAFSFILGNRTTPIQANDQIVGAAGAVLLGRGTTAATINPLRSQARACINSAVVGP